MDWVRVLSILGAVAPVALMMVAAVLPRLSGLPAPGCWRAFRRLSILSFLALLASACAPHRDPAIAGVLRVTPLGLVMALLVQLLGTVIGAFSKRYLDGEAGQPRYVAALAGVLAAVQLLLVADHWVVLILAWAWVGWELERLLCFYPERPFARLAAHKKRMADRAADVLLVAAAALAWRTVGSGSLSCLWSRLGGGGLPILLQLSALAFVSAVILRTALLPVHGWLIQVMEAPTPVSALLHAGVVNLGGFMLIRFSPLLDRAMPARVLLVGFGLGTAVLAGMVMLTRVSIKVRLAWSTAAQMGYMVLECGLGLYTLAALHLIGHSLYKAHSFLSAAQVVRGARLQAMHPAEAVPTGSLVLAPAVSLALVLLLKSESGLAAWPWWWSAVLGLAWAPLLWIRAGRAELRSRGLQVLGGLFMVGLLTCAALWAHGLPLGVSDTPHPELGLAALLVLVGLYVFVALLQRHPQALTAWRRWCYAGFYLDEAYTRIALQLWPARWASEALRSGPERPILSDDPR